MTKANWFDIRPWVTTSLLLRSIPIGIVIVTGIFATLWTHGLLSDQRDMVVHTYRVIDRTKDVLIALDDAETGERGYLLGADQQYLDPYEKALDRLGTMRSQLRELVTDNSAQIDRLDRLDRLIEEKLNQLSTSIALMGSQGFEAARRHAVATMKIATMDDIRKVIGMITQAEVELLDTRASAVADDENLVRLVAVLIALASLVVRTSVEVWLAQRRRRGG